MFFDKKIVLSALAISSTQALSFPEINLPDVSVLTRSIPPLFKKGGKGSATCPPVWTNVVRDLTTLFLDTTTSQCNDDARAAIRESLFSKIRISTELKLIIISQCSMTVALGPRIRVKKEAATAP